MLSSIKGIAGYAIQSVKIFELPEVDVDNFKLDL